MVRADRHPESAVKCINARSADVRAGRRRGELHVDLGGRILLDAKRGALRNGNPIVTGKGRANGDGAAPPRSSSRRQCARRERASVAPAKHDDVALTDSPKAYVAA